MSSHSIRIRGKYFTDKDIETIRSLITEYGAEGRNRVSQKVCEQLGWEQPNGQLQDVACRGIMLRLERCGLVELPPRRNSGNYRDAAIRSILELPLEDRHEEVTGRLGEFSGVRLERVSGERAREWNGWLGQYHYLGYKPMVGRSLKYWIFLGETRVGCIGWGSPSWKLASRDEFIGWRSTTREKNLQGIANNTRFLIFPWVHVKYLASHVLSLCARQVPADWETYYGVRLFLFETFVDAARYRGTCYKAANWIRVGQSKGSSKSGDSYHYHGRKKDVYLYPLTKDFRERLCQ